MKKSVFSALAIGTCLTLAGGATLADSGKDKCGERPRWAERMLEKFDTNKDGRITRQEFDAAHEARLKERFKKMDANKDGVVSFEEYRAARRDFGKRFFERMDRDGDGVVTRDELGTPPFSWRKPAEDK